MLRYAEVLKYDKGLYTFYRVVNDGNHLLKSGIVGTISVQMTR
jgi:hypothetical protein